MVGDGGWCHDYRYYYYTNFILAGEGVIERVGLGEEEVS